MHTAEHTFVSTATACLQAVRDDVQICHDEGLSADRMSQLRDVIGSLREGAMRVDARAIAMAAETFIETLDTARGRQNALAQIVQRQYELERLLSVFANGVRDLGQPQIEVGPEKLAAQTLSPLVKYCQSEDQKSALHALMRYAAGSNNAAADSQSVRLETVFAPLTAQALADARRRGKKISLSYHADDYLIDSKQAQICKTILTALIKARLSDGIESPDLRRVAGKSVTARMALQARAVNGGTIILSLSDDGLPDLPETFHTQTQDLNAILSGQGMDMSYQSAADGFICELTLRRGRDAAHATPRRAGGLA